MRRFVLLTVFLSASCFTPPPKPDTRITADQLTINGEQRLTDKVVPQRYKLDLEIDPKSETFRGKVAIEVDMLEQTQVFYLHSDGLDIAKASVDTTAGSVDAEVALGSNNGVALILPAPIAAGSATLNMEYSAPLDEVPTGLYRVKEGDRWYAFTQFEPLEARQAFPSFDEPKFKTPYQTTLRVPTGWTAASNTPETSKTTEGTWDVHKFAQSKPMPTYLVAFAVGEFDVVEAPADTIANVPFRILTAKGKGEQAQYMLKRTPSILATLSEYFGEPYPYEKLDVVAVPNFAAGAMENIGLVTFRERLLLIDPASASIRSRLNAVSVMAHELAHMWFGNLVTMPWWDDLWLNESFATWMAQKTVERMLPQLESDIDAVASMRWVMSVDSDANARAIRQPIKDSGDIRNAFDGLTYRKGASVVRMFETWMGEEKFQAGVRAYLGAHRDGTATTADFLAALDKAAGTPVAPKFETFLNQPGVPLLETSLTCDKKEKKATLSLAQSRYLPAGSTADPAKTWGLPYCVKFEDGRNIGEQCGVLETANASVDLPTERCPRWYYPNIEERGYYRWTMPEKDFLNLLKRYRKKLTEREKVGLSNNLSALAEANKISAETYVEAALQLAKERHRAHIDRTISLGYQFDRVVEDPKLRKKFSRRAKSLLNPHLRLVGYSARKGEEVSRTMVRPKLLGALGVLAEDRRTLKLAQKTADEFIADPTSVPVDMATMSLKIAAASGDAELWDKLSAMVSTAPNPGARVAVISALGSFEDPELQKKSLALFLSDTVRSQDMWTLIGPMTRKDAQFGVLWEWFTANYDGVVAKIGTARAAGLPNIGRGFCSAEGKAKVEAFFAADTGRRKPGSGRNLKNTLEGIERCEAFRSYLRPAVEKWVK